MEQIIIYLKNIQDNLIGIILPVLITAFISLVTVFVNAFIQIKLQNSSLNNEQYKLMQAFYPKIKIFMLELKLSIQEVKCCNVCTDMNTAIDKYIEFKSDEAKYRKNYPNEIHIIDGFITAMNNYVDITVKINDYFNACTVPRVPIMHPVLKVCINKMLAVLQYYSLLWYEYQKNIDPRIFIKEIKDFKENWGVEWNDCLIDKYISLLDKWMMKY